MPNPSSLPDLLLWLDAKGLGLADAASVTTWADLSGNGYDYTDAGNPPAYDTPSPSPNGAGAVQFDGTNDRLTNGDAPGLRADLTGASIVFLLQRKEATSAYETVWAATNGYGVFLTDGSVQLYPAGASSADISVDEHVVVSITFATNGDIAYWVNGTAAGTTSHVTTDDLWGVHLGAHTVSSGEPFQGPLYGLIVCESVLSTADRQLAEGYLAWRYGIQSSLPAGHDWEDEDPDYAPVTGYYLLESGAPDRYQLEDASGFLLGEDATVALTVTPGLVSSTGSPFSPAFRLTVTPGLVGTAGTTFTPAFRLTVAPGLISQTGTTSAPTVVPGSVTLTPALITATGSVFAPAFRLSVTPGLISHTGAVSAPTIVPGSVPVTPGLISQAGATFSPTLTVGAVTVTPGLISAAGSPFAPVVQAAGSTVTPALIGSAGTATAPTIVPGAVTVTPALVSAVGSPFAPVVVPDQFATPGLITSTGSPFAPVIAPTQFVALGVIGQPPALWSPVVELVVTNRDTDVRLVPSAIVASLTPGGGVASLTPALGSASITPASASSPSLTPDEQDASLVPA